MCCSAAFKDKGQKKKKNEQANKKKKKHLEDKATFETKCLHRQLFLWLWDIQHKSNSTFKKKKALIFLTSNQKLGSGDIYFLQGLSETIKSVRRGWN